MTDIRKVYCIPKGEAEFDLLGDRSKWTYVNGAVYSEIPYYEQSREGKTEISVNRFSDMIHDRITPWRLEDIGGYMDEHIANNWVVKVEESYVNVIYSEKNFSVSVENGHSSIEFYITKFTDFMNIISFLTKPTDK